MTNYLKTPSKGLNVLMFVLMLITGIGLCYAQCPRFADHLYAQGDYSEAATEYKKILFHEVVDSADSLYIVQMLMRSLFQTADRDGMFKISETYASILNQGDLAARYNALLMIKEGYYVPAYSLLDDRPDHRARLLKAICLEYMGESKSATTQLRELITSDSDVANMADTALKVQQLANKPHSPSPLLAGTLGIIPGAGYAVTGRIETAIASLVLNSALLISSVELYRKDLKWSAGIVFSVFTGFYLGNIYGSAAAAAKDRSIYKAAKLDDYLKRNVEGLLKISENNASSP